jgi:SAM-dependent methyltransferase
MSQSVRQRQSELPVVSEYFPDTPLGAEKNGVQCQNLEALTFKDNSFDLVITEDVLEHVVNVRKALSEIHRVLKQGRLSYFHRSAFAGFTDD